MTTNAKLETLRVLMLTTEREWDLPQSHLERPMVVTTKILERAMSDDSFRDKLQGWKWDVLWTTEAMKWVAERGLLPQAMELGFDGKLHPKGTKWEAV